MTVTHGWMLTIVGTPQDIHNSRRDWKVSTTEVGVPSRSKACATINDLCAHSSESAATRITVAAGPQAHNPMREENARPEGLEPSTDRVETGCSIR